jgi:predicted nucleic acid-binding protein
MPDYLLDTSVYCQPLKRRPVAEVIDRWARTGDSRCATSRVCVAEVEAGLQAEGRRTRIAKYEALLLPRISIIPVAEDIWRGFTELKASEHRLGQKFADLDLLIAATAIRHSLILATLNTRHFSAIEGLRWEDWGAP